MCSRALVSANVATCPQCGKFDAPLNISASARLGVRVSIVDVCEGVF